MQTRNGEELRVGHEVIPWNFQISRWRSNDEFFENLFYVVTVINVKSFFPGDKLAHTLNTLPANFDLDQRGVDMLVRTILGIVFLQ